MATSDLQGVSQERMSTLVHLLLILVGVWRNSAVGMHIYGTAKDGVVYWCTGWWVTGGWCTGVLVGGVLVGGVLVGGVLVFSVSKWVAR